MKKALLDLGSNTMRLSVYQLDEENKFNIMFSQKETVGLVNYITDNKMSYEGLDKACSVIMKFKDILSQISIDEMNIFATASLRNISNTTEAVEYIKEKTGENVTVLSGQEEAELGYYGAINDGDIESGVILDIGGGSVELAKVEDRNILSAKRYEIGSLNLFNAYVKGIWPKSSEEKLIKAKVKETLSFAAPNETIDTVYGIGGTNRALLSIANTYFKKSSENTIITFSEFKQLKKVILKKDDISKKLILKNCPDRIHTIIPGMFITYEIMKLFDSSQIIISKNGVREGYLCKKLMVATI